MEILRPILSILFGLQIAQMIIKEEIEKIRIKELDFNTEQQLYFSGINKLNESFFLNPKYI